MSRLVLALLGSVSLACSVETRVTESSELGICDRYVDVAVTRWESERADDGPSVQAPPSIGERARALCDGSAVTGPYESQAEATEAANAIGAECPGIPALDVAAGALVVSLASEAERAGGNAAPLFVLCPGGES